MLIVFCKQVCKSGNIILYVIYFNKLKVPFQKSDLKKFTHCENDLKRSINLLVPKSSLLSVNEHKNLHISIYNIL